MAVAVAQLGLVVVLAVDALIVLVLFAAGAYHGYNTTIHFVIF